MLFLKIGSITVFSNINITRSLSIVASGRLGSNYFYQWYNNNTNITSSGTLLIGKTNDSFTHPTASVGTLYYYCVATQATGLNCNVTSVICLGQNPSPLTIVTNSDSLSPNYQWYSKTTTSNSGAPPTFGCNQCNL